MIRLILGGARSGKSSFAEMIAKTSGGSEVIYLATAEAGDQEMEERIEKHQQSRPDTWKTIEEPYQVSKVINSVSPGSVVLLDCITVLISNILMKGEKVDKDRDDFEFRGSEEEVLEELASLIKGAKENNLELIMVSNLIGMGLVPAYKLGRECRDVAGRGNQYLGREADEVYLTCAGLPIEIKELGLKNLARFNKVTRF